MKTHQLDPTYSKLMQFAKKYQKKHGIHGLSNLYLLRSIDENGNVVDEKYGMNLMTNYGFESYFSGGATASFPTKIYFGNGSGNLELDKSTLLDGNTLDLSVNASSTTIDYNLPLYYDAEGGIITFVCKYMTASIPATIPGVTENFLISEYGIGASNITLWTHSYVYKSDGSETTTITKKPGTQLDVVVYFCLSINESIIKEAWDGTTESLHSLSDPYVLTTIEPVRWSTDYTSFYTKSGGTYFPVTGGSAPTWVANTYYEKVPHLNPLRKYIMFTRMNCFFDRMIYTHFYTFKNNSVVYDLPNDKKNPTSSPFDSSSHSISKWMNLNGSYTLNPGTNNNTGYISGFKFSNDGLAFFQRIFLQNEESFKSVISLPSDSSYLDKEDCLSRAIGTTEGLEFDQPFITKACCYNYATGEYDLEEEIDADNSIWYNEFLNNTNAVYEIYYDVNGTISRLYLFINPCTDDPILGFEASGVQTIISTDSYWDFSSWYTLINTSNIPQSEQRRKYYLSSSNTPLLPIREKRRFNIRPINGYTRKFAFINWLKRSRTYAVSTTKDFYVLDKYLYRISQNETIDLGTGECLNNVGKYIICYDDSIVTVKDNGIVYTTQYKSQGTITNTTFSHSATNITNFMNCQITEGSTFQPENLGQQNAGKNGLVMFSLYDTQALLLKIGSALSITETVINDSLTACMISGSVNYAYILKSNDHDVIIKNGNNGNTVGTVTIPGTYAKPKYMFGFRDKLYVSGGSGSSAYTLLIDFVDTSDITLSTCNIAITYDDIKYIRVTSVDDVMVVYNVNNINRDKEYYILYNDPDNISTLHGLGTHGNNYNPYQSNVLRLYEKYGGLYLVWNVNYSSNDQSTVVVYEFSKFIHDRETAYAARENTASPYILFGDSFIAQNTTVLLSNFITHEITGTTKTVTAHNNIKNLSTNPSIPLTTTTITNVASWNGIPPGNKLGT